MPSGLLLQLPAVQYIRQPNQKATVSPVQSCTSDYWCQTVLSYHTCSAAVILAACQTMIDYKVACLVHQSLLGHALRYLADNINLITNSSHHLLQSASDRSYVVLQTYTRFGDRSPNISASHVWNALPWAFLFCS